MTEIEDRLHAHFADRTEREKLPPAPDPDEVRARSVRASVVSRWPLRVTLAAAAAVIAIVVGLVVLTNEPTDITVVGPSSTAPTTTDEVTTTTSLATTSTTSTTSTTTVPVGIIASIPVVVTVNGVAGWWEERWVQAGPDFDIPVQGGEEYRIVRLDDPITTAVGSAARPGCEVSVPNQTIEVGLEYPGGIFDPPPIAVSGIADPRPRAVEVLDPQAAVYRDAAREVLADRGIDEPDPRVVQVVRGDLEGDGTAEVFVVVERVADQEYGYPEAGDYSILFVRQIVDGVVRTTVLHEHVADGPPYLVIARASALADLSGDGRMELAIWKRYYEGASTSIFEVDATGTFTEVMSAGCGV